MTRVDKPALLRRVFALACEYAGRELTYEKFVGRLSDAGNTTTVAHYLDLLDGAGLIRGLQKYSGEAVRRRRSSPKLVVHNTALMSAYGQRTFAEARSDPAWWGRVVEAAVGAQLIATSPGPEGGLFYWRDGGLEVDYVVKGNARVRAIEVKSGAQSGPLEGLAAFARRYPDSETTVVGTGGVALEDFFSSA